MSEGWATFVCPSCGVSQLASVDPGERRPCGHCGASLREAVRRHDVDDAAPPPEASPRDDADDAPPAIRSGPEQGPEARKEIGEDQEKRDRRALERLGREFESGYKPITALSRVVIGSLVVMLMLDLVGAGSDLAELSLLNRIHEGENVSQAEADANDTR